jgi:hypothetical protein
MATRLVGRILGGCNLITRKLFFWFNVNRSLFYLRHVFQNRILHLMSDAMPFPHGQIPSRANESPTYDIVGVVGDAKYHDWQQPTPRTIYLDAFQESRIVSEFTLRTAIDPEAVASAMTDQINASIVPERLTAMFSTWFGALQAPLRLAFREPGHGVGSRMP